MFITMFSGLHTLLAVVCALLLWMPVGFVLAARIANTSTAIAFAPIVGWAAQSVIALFTVSLVGQSWLLTAATLVLPTIAALLYLIRDSSIRKADQFDIGLIGPLILAVLLAVLLSVVIFPKISPDGVALAPAVFDHTKVALIDEMRRHGVPPVNPFVTDHATDNHIAYYYLWHFSAAQFSLLLRITGWESDAGLTTYTIFASLSVMMGLARYIAGKSSAAWWVVPVVLAGSLRTIIDDTLGWEVSTGLAGYRTGFSGWAFQAGWAPQHIASATVAIVCIWIFADLLEKPAYWKALLLGVLATASLQSSTWIGGLTLPISGLAAAVLSGKKIGPGRDRLFLQLKCMSIAAGSAIVLGARFILDQSHLSSVRGMGLPIAIIPHETLGEYFSESVGRILDPFAYWIVALPIELSAAYVIGIWMLVRLYRDPAWNFRGTTLLSGLLSMLAASLLIGGYVASTIGHNNDLGWRSLLPADMLLTVIASAGLARYWSRQSIIVNGAMIALILCGGEDTRRLLASSLHPQPSSASAAFERSENLWFAVRRHSSDTDRVLNNPDYLAPILPWPINASWALLSDRRSCYANDDFVLPFSSFNAEKRENARKLFSRLFDGKADSADIARIRTSFDCSVIVTTPDDPVWRDDTSLTNGGYAIVEGTPEWKIYKAASNVN